MWAQVEQQALARTLQQVGPEQDTLCAGWRTRHLAAHLYLRAHQPWQLLGLSRGTGVDELAEECRDVTRYEQVIEQFLQQPSWPWRLGRLGGLDELGNLVEYVVHHEDVRRAGDALPPRVLPPEMVAAIWARFAPMAVALSLPAPVGIVLMVPGQPRMRRRARPGADPVRLVGQPVELALYAMGRRDQAQVELRGSTSQVQRLTDWLSER